MSSTNLYKFSYIARVHINILNGSVPWGISPLVPIREEKQ